MNNPMQMIKMMMGKGNPKEMVMNMLKSNSNPICSNLLTMMQNGDEKGIEDFARNMMKEKNRDFDKEFSEFMDNFK